jgi:hypothetical protein
VIRKVVKGQELVASYVPVWEDSKTRQIKLKSNFGFHCQCQACSLPKEKVEWNDRARLFVKDALELVRSEGEATIADVTLKRHGVVCQAIRLMKEEGIVDPETLELANDAVTMSIFYGYRQTAEIWISEVLEVLKGCGMVGTSEWKAFEVLREDVTCHPAWKLLAKD